MTPTPAGPMMQLPSSGLSLSFSATSTIAVTPSYGSRSGIAEPSPARPFNAPGTTDVRELTRGHPMVRLNARQSAVGTLVVTGATTVVWESSEWVTGSHSISGVTAGAVVSTPGNRPLVCLSDGQVMIALRHVSRLRRALLFSEEPAALGVQLYGGVLGLPAPGPGLRNMLMVSRVGRQLELRSESMSLSVSCEDIPDAFGFKMSVSLLPSHEGF